MEGPQGSTARAELRVASSVGLGHSRALKVLPGTEAPKLDSQQEPSQPIQVSKLQEEIRDRSQHLFLPSVNFQHEARLHLRLLLDNAQARYQQMLALRKLHVLSGKSWG